jgi:ABC-type uncharacterized transport system substrate-binding protein
MVSVGDPVGFGFIASLARPGGNITGLTNISIDLSPKLIELFAELVPGMKLVGVVHSPNNPAVTVALRETEDAVRKLNIQVEVVDAQTSDEFERAFAQLRAKSADGVVAAPRLYSHRTQAEDRGACAIGATADGLSTPRECRCGWPLLVWT